MIIPFSLYCSPAVVVVIFSSSRRDGGAMASLHASPSFSAAAIPVVYVPTTTCGSGGVDKIYEEERSIHRTKIYEEEF